MKADAKMGALRGLLLNGYYKVLRNVVLPGKVSFNTCKKTVKDNTF